MSTALAHPSSLLVLGGQRTLSRHLLFGLLVSMGDELVEETTRLALVVTITLSPIDFSLQVASCLVIDVVLGLDLVDVGYPALAVCGFNGSLRNLTVLVVHRQLALQLLPNVLHRELSSYLGPRAAELLLRWRLEVAVSRLLSMLLERCRFS